MACLLNSNIPKQAKIHLTFHDIFYLICACHTANFGLLLRGQPHWVLIFEFFVSSIDLKVTGNLVTRIFPKRFEPRTYWFQRK